MFPPQYSELCIPKLYNCIYTHTYIYIGNLPVVMSDIQINENIQDPVYDEVRKESSQVLSSSQGPDPVYQESSSLPRLITTSIWKATVISKFMSGFISVTMCAST